MMNIKHFLMAMLLLSVVSCERMETYTDQHLEGKTPVPFTLDTKALPEGKHTYRVVMVANDCSLKGNGTYCNEIITPGVMGSWLSPCRVNDDGEPLTSTGSSAGTFEEADKSGLHGLRYDYNFQSTLYLAAATPAVNVKIDNGKTYFAWSADKEQYFSNFELIRYEGNWIGNNYVFNSSQAASLELKDRRARLFVQIKCGELEEADIQSVKVKYINEAQWYVPGGFSAEAGHYSWASEPRSLYDWSADGGIKHLNRATGDVWQSEGAYILPLAYETENKYSDMKPTVEIQMGTNTETPGRPISIEIAKDLEPMNDYLMELEVSKQFINCRLSVRNWIDAGTFSTSDEGWARIAIDNGESSWETQAAIGTEGWNTNF